MRLAPSPGIQAPRQVVPTYDSFTTIELSSGHWLAAVSEFREGDIVSWSLNISSMPQIFVRARIWRAEFKIVKLRFAGFLTHISSQLGE